MYGKEQPVQQPGVQGEDPPSPGSVAAAVRSIHQSLPLAGDPVNALLDLPDDLLFYLVTLLRNTPCPAPQVSRRDWDTLIRLLRPHWVYPLISYHLNAWPEECRPPKEFLEELNRISLSATARTLLAGRQIGAVTGALREVGIPAILLKGPALARTVYPDPTLRQSSDIDLIVLPQDITAAEDVLERLGYRCPAKVFHICPCADHHEKFFPKAHGFRLQLHWATAHEFGLFPESWLQEAFARRIIVHSDGITFDTFCPPDQLLYLVFHDAFQHRAIRLDWIYDISRVMQEIPSRDKWDDLIRQSVTNTVRIPLEHCLAAASLWSGTPLPPGAADPSLWPAPSEREVRIQKKYSAPRLFFLSRLFLAMQQRPGCIEKLRYVQIFLLPPAPLLWEYRKSSSPLDIPLAHLRRWSRIVTFRL